MKLLFTLLLGFSLSGNCKQPQIEVKAPTISAKFGKHRIEVEIADTPEKQERGLMFRKSMGENHGMLFIFKDSEIRHFWMKNTFIDLSIAYLNHKKAIINILEMTASKSEIEADPTIYSSSGPAEFALEMNREWFAKNKIKSGDILVLENTK